MSRTLRFFNKAIDTCLLTRNLSNKKLTNIHGSVIVRGGTVIGRGINTLEPMNLTGNTNNTSSYTHSEVMSVKNFILTNKSKGSSFRKNIPFYNLSMFLDMDYTSDILPKCYEKPEEKQNEWRNEKQNEWRNEKWDEWKNEKQNEWKKEENEWRKERKRKRKERREYERKEMRKEKRNERTEDLCEYCKYKYQEE